MESKLTCQICHLNDPCISCSTEESTLHLCNECFTSTHSDDYESHSHKPLQHYSPAELEVILDELNQYKQQVIQQKENLEIFQDRVTEVIETAFSQYYAMIRHAKESLESLNDNRDLEAINDPQEREQLEGVNPEDVLNTLEFYRKRLEDNKDQVIDVIQNALNPQPQIEDKRTELLKLQQQKLQLELQLKENQIQEMEQRMHHYHDQQKMQEEWLEHLKAIQTLAESDELKNEIYDIVKSEISDVQEEDKHEEV